MFEILVVAFCRDKIAKRSVRHEGRAEKTDMSKMRQQRTEQIPAGERQPEMISQGNYYHDPAEVTAKRKPIKVGPKIGGNDPCPCGSGKKFKGCHGRKA